MVKKSEVLKEAKKSRSYRRLEETKRLLLLAGVNPTLVNEAIQKAEAMDLARKDKIKSLPTAVARRIGEVIRDEQMGGVLLYRTGPKSLELTPVTIDDRELTPEEFTPENWSLPKKSKGKK